MGRGSGSKHLGALLFLPTVAFHHLPEWAFAKNIGDGAGASHLMMVEGPNAVEIVIGSVCKKQLGPASSIVPVFDEIGLAEWGAEIIVDGQNARHQ